MQWLNLCELVKGALRYAHSNGLPFRRSTAMVGALEGSAKAGFRVAQQHRSVDSLAMLRELVVSCVVGAQLLDERRKHRFEHRNA